MDYSVIFSASTIASALLLGLALPVAVVLTYSRFGVGISLVALAFIVDTITMGDVALEVGLNLYYPDIFLLILAIAALIRYLVPIDRPKANLMWFLFCAIFLFSTLTGLMSYGSSAGVDARPYFYLAAVGLYGMSFRIESEHLNTLFQIMCLMAIFLIFLAFYRWIVYFTPITYLLPPEGTYNIDGAIRVIYSHHVLLIAQVSLLVIFYTGLSKTISSFGSLSPLFVGMVLILQHRSVWLATIAGFFARFLLGRNNMQSSQKKINLLYIFLALSITIAASQFSDGLQGISKQVRSGATTALAAEGSVGERLQSWQELIKIWIDAGPRSVLVGQSFGVDNTRYVKNERGELIKIDYAAHNFYVQTLFNLGILGLATYLFVVLFALRGLWKLRKYSQQKSLAEAFIVILVTQLVYYIPYGSDYFQGLLLGIIVAFISMDNEFQQSTHLDSMSTMPR
ncbi:MAG: O-antigen ligase family protein [Rhodoferax sp.]|nr:O-antigen ligase family protein [Rhodoferax sp.]